MVECANCGESNPIIRALPLWSKYYIGEVESSEWIHLCPECDNDPAVDPIQVWARSARVHRVEVKS